MKKFLSLGILLLTATIAFAQGKVTFANNSLRLVYLTTDLAQLNPADAGLAGQAVPLGGVLPSGATLVADLYAGTNAVSLSRVATTTFPTTGLRGLIASTNVILPSSPVAFPGGTTPYYFQVQVRDAGVIDATTALLTPGHYYGFTEVFQCRASSGTAYNSIIGTGNPSFSTWMPGTYPLDSVTPGAKGAIMVQGGKPCIVFPRSAVVLLGDPFTLVCSNSFNQWPLSFQWRLNGAVINDATNSIYTRTNAQYENAGTYSVTVTDAATNICSSEAVLQVLQFGAPSIRVNGELAVGAVAAVASAEVTISGGFTNGSIFYTLDGTTPSFASPLYSGAITLTNSATVQAMSLSEDFSQTAQAPPVVVQIIPAYNLSTSVVGSGTIGVIPAGGAYASNSIVTLTATPSGNWLFHHWAGDASGSQNPLAITMDRPRSVQAVFVQTAYPLTVGTPGGGSVTVDGQAIAPSTFFPFGSVVTLAATGSNGWSFLQWQGDAAGTNNPLMLTMDKTNQVQAIFGTEVRTNMSGPGTIALSPTNPVPFGTLLTATALPAPGYYIRLWSGPVSGTNVTATGLITNATPTVGALFVAVPEGRCSLNVLVNGDGTVLVNPLKVFYDLGDTVSLTASTTNPAAGFSGWAGDASGTNNPLALLMNTNKIVTATFGSPPAVTVSPQDLVVLAGSNAVLTANAVGLPPLNYQWWKGLGHISGATNPTYTITGAQAGDAGEYSVVVSNSYGSATSGVATVTVVWPPSISLSPSSVAAAAGTSLNLSVAASGTEPLRYQWINGSGPIPDATNATCTVNPVQTNHTGDYFVIVTNLYGAATSGVATVFVYVPVQILTQPASRVVTAGSTVSFSLLASGYPAPAYQWRFGVSDLPGATSSTLTITNVRLSDLGDYSVLAGNGYSSALSDAATLQMFPSITTPYVGATAIWGRSATLSVTAIGSGDLSYQWYKDGAVLESGTNQILSLPTVGLGDAGFYSVVVSSALGSVTNSAQLVVNPANMDLGMYAGITISGAAGYRYDIQYTTDLTDTNSWISLTNLTLQQEVELWVDTSTNTLKSLHRYYRILPLPPGP